VAAPVLTLGGGNIASTSSRRLAGRAAPPIMKALMPWVARPIDAQADS
jgi:hypothetical protein